MMAKSQSTGNRRRLTRDFTKINEADPLTKAAVNNSIFAIAMREVLNKKNRKRKKTLIKKISDFVQKDNVMEILDVEAIKIGSMTGANVIISIEKIGNENDKNDNLMIKVKVTIFRENNSGKFEKSEYYTLARPALIASSTPIKEVLVEAIKENYIEREDRVVCIDDGFGAGFKGVISVFDVKDLFFNINVYKFTDSINPEIIEAVINIALEIGREGREGKHVGTAFIIGERDQIMKFAKQMIINPFNGYPENMRNIIDPELKETIKNLAQLDGVFMIDNKGIIISAGTYLDINTNIPEIKNLKGFGTRHRCAAAITKHTKAIAVVVSESGGKIRIFKNGKIMMTLI